jgi:hypothetical protein
MKRYAEDRIIDGVKLAVDGRPLEGPKARAFAAATGLRWLTPRRSSN